MFPYGLLVIHMFLSLIFLCQIISPPFSFFFVIFLVLYFCLYAHTNHLLVLCGKMYAFHLLYTFSFDIKCILHFHI